MIVVVLSTIAVMSAAALLNGIMGVREMRFLLYAWKQTAVLLGQMHRDLHITKVHLFKNGTKLSMRC